MSAYLVDCHNHSLPNIDDGAKDICMALGMLSKAELCGTREVILTPHHLNGAFSNTADKIRKSFEVFAAQAANHGVGLKLHLASEVHMAAESADQLISGQAMTYCGLGKAALLEPPKRDLPMGYQALISKLLSNNITPIIAHPERNEELRRNLPLLKQLVELGCKVQLTAQSVTGDFGKRLQEVSQQMIDNRLVHLVASDAHRIEGRSPDLQPAYQFVTSHYGEPTAALLFEKNPLRLTGGDCLISLDSVEATQAQLPQQQLSSTDANQRESVFSAIKKIFSP